MSLEWNYVLKELTGYYPEREARSILRLIQEVRFGITQMDICLGRQRSLSSLEREDLKNILNRLKKKEPIQYVLGEADFYGYSYHVEPGVLIPRPETEELVNWILSEEPNTSLSILDIGTGSGCIAITLAKNMPQASVTAFDISLKALSIAQTNAERMQTQVHFRQTDILRYIPDNGPTTSETETIPKWDIIVSNPPYVCLSEAAEMDVHVKCYEPHEALFVPDNNPLIFYQAIAHYARYRLQPGGKLYVEINQRFGNETMSVFRQTGFQQIELRKDFCNQARMIRCTL